MQNGGPTGTASNGVVLGPVTFSGHNSVAVDSKAERVYVLCGNLCVRISSCKLFIIVLTSGTLAQTAQWNWSGLTTSGGTAGSSSECYRLYALIIQLMLVQTMTRSLVIMYEAYSAVHLIIYPIFVLITCTITTPLSPRRHNSRKMFALKNQTKSNYQ